MDVKDLQMLIPDPPRSISTPLPGGNITFVSPTIRTVVVLFLRKISFSIGVISLGFLMEIVALFRLLKVRLRLAS